MAEKQGTSGFANNPIIKAIGAQRLVVILVIITLAMFFSVMSEPFRKYATVVSIFDYSYYVSFAAIGVTFALVTGGVDLSIGTGMVCYGLVGGYLVVNRGMPVGVGIAVAIGMGAIMGLINGSLVARMELPPFIATLCTMMVTRGLGSILCNGMSVAWPSSSSEQGWFRGIFKYGANFKNSENVTMIPVGFILVIIFAIIMSLFLNKSKPGRYIIAIGSNKEATRLSGINVVKYQTLAYVISGISTGIAGVAYAAIFQAIAPGTGAGFELDAIGGAIIGGTSMTGGYGTIFGTLLGVFVMSLLKTGLPYIGLQANWQQIITGIVLLVAVMIDVLKNAKSN